MNATDGARHFQTSGSAYDRFMGRWSRLLGPAFADAADVRSGMSALDVGCGPGALTQVLVGRLGGASVAACDPSESFAAACFARHPEVDVRVSPAESLPFEDRAFDRVMAQLVLHFVSDAEQVAKEFRRVLRPGGLAAACVWDFAEGMQMLRLFWDAAIAIAPDAPDEVKLRFGREGEIAELWTDAGLEQVRESTLTVTSTYANFDELWAGFLAGVGPAGAWCVAQDHATQEAVRSELFARLGGPEGPFSLDAVARYAVGALPKAGHD